MRRAIATSNPFRNVPRFAFGYEYIEPGMRLLDYGCNEAWFGTELLKHKRVEYIGVDKNGDLLKQERAVPIVVIKDRLPFDDNSFDVSTAFEVLEHIHDQDAVLRELWRVTKPNGLLIVSVPRKNPLSFLDIGNWKYVFPRTHRMYFTLRYSAEKYQHRYVENPFGLVGTVEKEKGWHQHFSEQDMRALVERNNFEIVEEDGAGLLCSIFDVLEFIPPLRPLFPQSVRNWDSYAFHARSLLCAARKVSGQQRA